MTTISSSQIHSLRDSDARINIWEGAVRSGKTYISLWRFIKELSYGPVDLNKHPGKSLREVWKDIEDGKIEKQFGEFAIIARTADSFKRNVLPQLVRMIGSDVRNYSGKREMHVWGQTIHVVGADDERAESKIRGPTFSGAYVDEATIVPESVFKMLISRCAMGGAKIFATTNPDSPYHWLKKDFLTDNPDVKSWKFTLEDNPELCQDEKDYLKRQYRGLWFQRFIEGKWVQAEGAVYDFFDLGAHCIDFPLSTATNYIVGVDYGTTNPTSFILVGINANKFPNVWVEDEYFYDSKKHQRQKTDAEYGEALKIFIRYKSVTAIFIDPSAASFKAELFKQGFDNVFDAENEVVDGIRLVSTFLGEGTMKICRKCTNLIQEFQSYVWDAKSAKTGVDKPLKENDHALDALRYALYTHFFGGGGGLGYNGSGKGPLTPRDLERIEKESRGESNLPPFFQQTNDGNYPNPMGF